MSAQAEALHRFDPPWIRAGRAYRQACLLKLEGRDEEARRVLDGEFGRAEAEALAACRGEPDAETGFRAFIAAEAERMAHAVALAEVLAPELAARLGWAGGARVGPAVATARQRPAEPRGEHAIADYIEQMLAQERAVGS